MYKYNIKYKKRINEKVKKTIDTNRWIDYTNKVAFHKWQRQAQQRKLKKDYKKSYWQTRVKMVIYIGTSEEEFLENWIMTRLIIKDKNVRDSKFSNKQAVKTTKATHSVANQ